MKKSNLLKNIEHDLDLNIIHQQANSFWDEDKKDEYSLYLFNKNFIDLTDKEYELLYIFSDYLQDPIWKPILIDKKYSGYDICDAGFVRNKNGFILKGRKNIKGYLGVGLFFKGKQYSKRIHRLVAEAFIPNPDNKPQVNHINGIKTCNWVVNLEWVTNQENMNHSIKYGLRDHLLGEGAPNNKYSEIQIRKVCELLEENKLSNKRIAELTGLSRQMVYEIKAGNEWKIISSEYNIPKLIPQFRYPVDKIELACKLLEENKLSMVEIASIVGMNKHTVYDIKRKRIYKPVVSKYNIPD